VFHTPAAAFPPLLELLELELLEFELPVLEPLELEPLELELLELLELLEEFETLEPLLELLELVEDVGGAVDESAVDEEVPSLPPQLASAINAIAGNIRCEEINQFIIVVLTSSRLFV
jgi:hypothetical protein